MRPSGKEFLSQKNKAITLIGMSGVGKTTLANKLTPDKWFHYSGDYRIGTFYLNEPIMDNIKAEAMKVPFLRDLLMSDSIFIANNITVHNLAPVSTFLGKIGNLAKRGKSLEKFKQRQALHREAEINAMRDVPIFIKKARELYNYQHFINDVGGSICEVATPEVLEILAKHTVILYLKADEAIEQEMIKRAEDNPKPLYYQPDFLDENVELYLKEKNLATVAQIEPDDFSRWVFPRLLAHRRPLYQKIADDYGYTLDATKIEHIKDDNELLQWVAQKLDEG